jgi:hypothetical protein
MWLAAGICSNEWRKDAWRGNGILRCDKGETFIPTALVGARVQQKGKDIRPARCYFHRVWMRVQQRQKLIEERDKKRAAESEHKLSTIFDVLTAIPKRGFKAFQIVTVWTKVISRERMGKDEHEQSIRVHGRFFFSISEVVKKHDDRLRTQIGAYAFAPVAISTLSVSVMS